MLSKMLNKYKGCMLGLALGDALGAAVEFMSYPEIKNKYGEHGIEDLDEWRGFEAGSYTDDTQMALATAIGCIEAAEEWKKDGIFEPTPYIYKEYLRWLETQADPFHRRAPGNTCLSALESGDMGSIDAPINDSKGCGGVMRVAPVGLVFSGELAFLEGAKSAAITHGHPSGYLSAGFLAELVSHILDEKTLEESIQLSRKTLITYNGHEETLMNIDGTGYSRLLFVEVSRRFQGRCNSLGESFRGQRFDRSDHRSDSGDASGKGSHSGRLDREARKCVEDRGFGRGDVPDLQGTALRVAVGHGQGRGIPFLIF